MTHYRIFLTPHLSAAEKEIISQPVSGRHHNTLCAAAVITALSPINKHGCSHELGHQRSYFPSQILLSKLTHGRAVMILSGPTPPPQITGWLSHLRDSLGSISHTIVHRTSRSDL
ncbi:hypothetical protein J6590_030778 [Homalodisca vitripennis]|nr:hypothetical protein J6590_030778 [Homalodisca vitripennis]